MYANWQTIKYIFDQFTRIFNPVSVSMGVFLLLSLMVTGNPAMDKKGKNPRDKVHADTVRKGGNFLLKPPGTLIPEDTSQAIPIDHGKVWDSSGYQKSQAFYDSIFKKFSRKKITQLLYPLAFRAPKQTNLPDSVQILKNTTPFDNVKGKVIRNISINVLSPFGTSIYDTCSTAQTTTGRALNSMHRNTRKHIIRRNLLFKKGDLLTPGIMADNERILKDINAIDNARILVTPIGQYSDTVDVIVLVKDVWSIGVDVPVVTAQRLDFRVYDANFFGLGDQVTTKMSMDIYRAPFFRLDGLSYTYSNIAGSFIDGFLDYTRNDIGNQNMTAGFQRSFITNHTKWAGGAGVTWKKDVNGALHEIPVTTYAIREGCWLGRAFLMKGASATSRGVIAASVYRNDFLSRPYVSIDSNGNYYNDLQVLSTLSLSKNNYYLTDYVLEFGKTENLPYGHLFQVTAGIDKTDFYSRIYSGMNLTAGNYFAGFGYLEAYAKFGGFFNHSSFEDAVIKLNLNYFTPLLKTPEQRFKFRTFFITDYRLVFNQRSNNHDYYNANLVFNISRVNNPEGLRGVNFFSVRSATKCFTPWYIYGFRFAITVDVQAGLLAQRGESLVNTSLFTGIGLGLIIKNDNLVFPALAISGYYYPASANDIRQLQVVVNTNLHVSYYNFNVGAPYEETLGN